MNQTYILNYSHSPFSTAYKGALSNVRPDDMVAGVIFAFVGDGGATALGPLLGETGARLAGKAASLLKRGGGRYGLATQSIGGGQGIATALEAA
jgi:acetyl-CoA acetyltransferase